jgi:hypothetical protein
MPAGGKPIRVFWLDGSSQWQHDSTGKRHFHEDGFDYLIL